MKQAVYPAAPARADLDRGAANDMGLPQKQIRLPKAATNGVPVSIAVVVPPNPSSVRNGPRISCSNRGEP